VTKLAAILDQIASGSVLLPEFQRGYVWNRDQVRGLMRSLYLGYSVSGLLTWETYADGSVVRGAAATSPAVRVLILDGQQRVTSLYGIDDRCYRRRCRRSPQPPRTAQRWMPSVACYGAPATTTTKSPAAPAGHSTGSSGQPDPAPPRAVERPAADRSVRSQGATPAVLREAASVRARV